MRHFQGKRHKGFLPPHVFQSLNVFNGFFGMEQLPLLLRLPQEKQWFRMLFFELAQNSPADAPVQ